VKWRKRPACGLGAKQAGSLLHYVLTIRKPSLYSARVKGFARSAAATALPVGPLARVAQLVQRQMDEVDARIVAQAAAFDPAIEGYVSYALGSGGKRLRPMVAILSGGATGSLTAEHIDLAVIVELIHLATLVHDDIMDEAERRRSQPTVNARWGNSLSVLLGDCLFAHALSLSTNFENADISRAIARTASEVCSGEMIQTQRTFDLQLSVDDYFRIIEMKTGSLFATAGELGATISGADSETIKSLKTFGGKIGTAYQIYDDCLDIAGTEAETGKTLGTDLRKGKLTLPVLMLLQSTSEFERERCRSLVLDGKLDEMTAVLRSASADGALSASIETATDLIRDAQVDLEKLKVNCYTDSLFALADALRDLLDQLRA
jgi:octaprenyl-diphosphate synthase